MSAKELLRAGKPRAAITELQKLVRQEPSVPKHRIFLFQLLCVAGQWDRAMTQLNVAAELDLDSQLMAQVYRPVLNSEALRAEVFAGQRLPLVFGDPAEWVTWMIEANRLTARGHAEGAEELRGRALEAAPAVPGQIDNQPFEWLGDADARLGPILEIIIDGKYFWVPGQNVAEIKIEAPADLRDLVWLPVICTWTNGGTAVGLMPVRYPGSENSPDGLIQLARKTDWVDNGHGITVGMGQRMLASEQEEYPLLETRRIVFQHAP